MNFDIWRDVYAHVFSSTKGMDQFHLVSRMFDSVKEDVIKELIEKIAPLPVWSFDLLMRIRKKFRQFQITHIECSSTSSDILQYWLNPEILHQTSDLEINHIFDTSAQNWYEDDDKGIARGEVRKGLIGDVSFWIQNSTASIPNRWSPYHFPFNSITIYWLILGKLPEKFQLHWNTKKFQEGLLINPTERKMFLYLFSRNVFHF